MIKKILPLKDPKFIKPVEIIFEQDGIERRWEAVEAHDSVAILLYHPKKDAFVLVKQFRPALAMQHGFDTSFELCAGIIDKAKTVEEIAKEEVLEETGYKVKFLEKITSFYTSVGFAGSKQTLFYGEVEEKVAKGGGIEEEKIEVIYLPVNEAKAFMYDESKPKTPGLLFAFCWWFERFNRNSA